ncbi:MAG: 30S ribosomal protein S14 [Candidatus Aenigmarchaeota archaeon]|nr:30S ribosomal protein S14 [Candidatus Aenigmarchaeota archaeon]
MKLNENKKKEHRRPKCQRCGRYGAVTKKYGLYYCRHCLREIAEKIGFKKYS